MSSVAAETVVMLVMLGAQIMLLHHSLGDLTLRPFLFNMLLTTSIICFQYQLPVSRL